MTISIKSRKAKGKRLQKAVKELLHKRFEFPDADVKVPPTSCPGEDIWLSYDARRRFPYSIECKAQEKLNLFSAFQQARSNASHFTPILVFTKNNDEILVTMKFEDFLYSLP